MSKVRETLEPLLCDTFKIIQMYGACLPIWYSLMQTTAHPPGYNVSFKRLQKTTDRFHICLRPTNILANPFSVAFSSSLLGSQFPCISLDLWHIIIKPFFPFKLSHPVSGPGQPVVYCTVEPRPPCWFRGRQQNEEEKEIRWRDVLGRRIYVASGKFQRKLPCNL